MSPREEIEYSVVLVSPGFGPERENAEQIVEEALNYLNTYRETPGLRFAPYVRANLEMATHLFELTERVESDDSLAMVILHEIPEEDSNDFIRACNAREVGVCRSVPAAEDDDDPKPLSEFQFVLRAKKEGREEPSAHTIADSTLSAPLDESEMDKIRNRIQQLIAVMALGVMQCHWSRHPPRYPTIS